MIQVRSNIGKSWIFFQFWLVLVWKNLENKRNQKIQVKVMVLTLLKKSGKTKGVKIQVQFEAFILWEKSNFDWLCFPGFSFSKSKPRFPIDLRLEFLSFSSKMKWWNSGYTSDFKVEFYLTMTNCSITSF